MDPSSLKPALQEVRRSLELLYGARLVRVVLFGSRARGSGAAHSDVDILIVEKDPFTQTRSRWKEISQLWDIVANFRIPVDILLYSQDEIEKWRNIKQHVISTALSEGVLLYERN